MKFLKKLRKALRWQHKTLLTIRVHTKVLRHNFNVYRKMCPDQAICPVLKSNAYGHGLVETARALESEKPAFFVVDSLFEARQLKRAGLKTPVLILGYNHPENLTGREKFHFTVSNFEDIEAYAKLGLPVHLEVDTGMNRMGVRMENLEEALKEAAQRKLKMVGLFTHLADADGASEAYNDKQLENFERAIQIAKNAGFSPDWIHVGNSAGAIKSREVPGVNMARLGIGLYGTPTLDIPEHKQLKPTLEFLSTIVSIRALKKGEKLSYNCTFEAPKDMKVAVLACGYHEGIPRALSNKGPFLGRVCMNHCFIEAQPGMKVGDQFPVYALEGKHSAVELAPLANTITYELLVRLDRSIRREYV